MVYIIIFNNIIFCESFFVKKKIYEETIHVYQYSIKAKTMALPSTIILSVTFCIIIQIVQL